MSDTEKEKFRQIGIDLINEYRVRGGFNPINWLAINTPEASAFIRSIQLHEKTKQELADVKQELADFRQRVSDAVEFAVNPNHPSNKELVKFILPAVEPDPLVMAFDGVTFDHYPPNDAKTIRAALDAAGFEIRKKNDV